MTKTTMNHLMQAIDINSYINCIGCESGDAPIEESALCAECVDKARNEKLNLPKKTTDFQRVHHNLHHQQHPAPLLHYSDQARDSDDEQQHTSSSTSFADAAAAFLSSYDAHVAERAAMAGGKLGGVSPKPLDKTQTVELVEVIKKFDSEKQTAAAVAKRLVHLLTNRVPPGVDDAARVKAEYLSDLGLGKVPPTLISPLRAVELLGTMQGGYNVATLVQLLESANADLRKCAVQQLKHTLLVYQAFSEIVNIYNNSSKTHSQEARAAAALVLQSWADGEWYTSKPDVPYKITVTVFKVTGETNTDDLSPAQDAWSRPDIPLHALAMLKNAREGIAPDTDGVVGPLNQMEKLLKKGHPLAYVGDVVGTGSSRKSATNSVIWFMGQDIPYVPNIKSGGVCIGGKIAPIFFNTMEDSGALPIEMEDVGRLNMGDVIDIYTREGKVVNRASGEVVGAFELKTNVLLNEVRAGGRIPFIIGKALTAKACAALGRDVAKAEGIFSTAQVVADDQKKQEDKKPKGYTLAQKMVGKACGLAGVRPSQYCEPITTTVGSQDTTGPMTRDELKSLACVEFGADLVMQSFCHTAAYPKPIDVINHKTLPDFIKSRGGVSLSPGDGVIHSWLNRMLVPDTVGTGGDSHTRFPIGVSFPAGSGLVAFAAATGTLPLDMPESVLVRFTGKMQPGITLRDLVQAIPYTAIQKGLLTVEKKGKKNVFSGRIIEIEGLPDLKCEQAFELSDSSAERSAAGCTIKLDKERVVEYLKSNVVLLKWMISEGYGWRETLERRAARMEEWLADPHLMEADDDAEYAEVIEINMDEINEPILALPNDPDATALLSEVAGTKIDEVFIGSCMTNIGHFRAAGKLLANRKTATLPTRLWVAPPTKMDEAQLNEEGYFSAFKEAGARKEIPGCSLCMGNQARVEPGSTVVSTSTRNFPNRLGQGASVYLGSAELAAITSILGRLPSVDEYMEYMAKINDTASDTYKYLKFDQMSGFVKASDNVKISAEMKEAAVKLNML